MRSLRKKENKSGNEAALMNIADAAAKKLSAGEMTSGELRAFLLKKGFAPEKTDDLIGNFINSGYLDDKRYCLMYFDHAFSKGKSKLKTFYELRDKGVSRQEIDAAYDEYEGDKDERARALKECRRILKTAAIGNDESVPEKILGKIARSLDRKGYGANVIYSVIEEIKK